MSPNIQEKGKWNTDTKDGAEAELTANAHGSYRGAWEVQQPEFPGQTSLQDFIAH